MLDCLDGLVYLDGTCEGCGSPTSGPAGAMAINRVGISESFLADICTSEDTPASLLADAFEVAKEQVRGDVLIKPMGVRAISIVERKRIAHKTNKTDTVQANRQGGILLTISPGQASLVVDIIRSVDHASTGAQLQVYDTATGQTVGTEEIKASRRTERYFITCGATGQVPRVVIDHNVCPCNTKEIQTFKHRGLRATGGHVPTGSGWGPDDVRTAKHTGGVELMLTLRCDHEAWLCEIAAELKLPLLYKTAELVMARAIHAVDRANNTTGEMEEWAKRASQYAAEYDSRMEALLASLQSPNDGVCFVCKTQKVFSRTAIP